MYVHCVIYIKGISFLQVSNPYGRMQMLVGIQPFSLRNEKNQFLFRSLRAHLHCPFGVDWHGSIESLEVEGGMTFCLA